MKNLLLLIVLITNAYFVAAQDRELDSLNLALKNSSPDTIRVQLLLTIAKKYAVITPEKAMLFANQSRDLSVKLNYPQGLAQSLKYLGIVYYKRSSYAEAISNWEHASVIFDSIKDIGGVANIQSNLGALYFQMGEDVKANEFNFKALKAAESIHDTVRISTLLNNIAAVYQNKWKTLNKAIEFYQNSLKLGLMIRDDDQRRGLVGATYSSLAEAYTQKVEKDTGNKTALLDTALYYSKLSIKEYTDMVDEPYALNQLAKIYIQKGDFDNAIKVQQRAYELAQKYESTDDMALSLVGLGESYKAKKDVNMTLSIFKSAEKLSNELGNLYYMKKIYEGLIYAYSEKKDYLNAYSYQLKLLTTKDSIYNVDQERKLQDVESKHELEKKEGEITLLTKDKQIQQQEIRRQKMVRNSAIGGFAVVLLFAGIFFSQRNKIAKEKKRSDELLLNILPSETAEELKATGTAKTKSFESVSVMFTDFKNFTQASELLTPEELVSEINLCYSEFDKIITRYNIEKIKTIGDSYMCAGGLPVANSTHPEDVVNAGLEMQQFILRIKAERMSQNKPYFDLRLGIHTGPVVAGIVGTKKFAYDIWGDTVNTASRMESSGEISRVNISGATYELIKDKFRCLHRGKIQAKNKGLIDMYFVEPSGVIETVDLITSGVGIIEV